MIQFYRQTTRANFVRHLYLVRHGQYFDIAPNLLKMVLTPLGREQLEYTGKHLNTWNMTFDRIIHSPMPRALESAMIINQQLDKKVEFIEDKDLAEGVPVTPFPVMKFHHKHGNVSMNFILCII